MFFDYAVPAVEAASKKKKAATKKPPPKKKPAPKKGPVRTMAVPERPADDGYNPPVEDIE